MAVTATSFLVGYPEFEDAGTDLIEAKLVDARLQVSAEVWGDRVDLGVSLLTAHTLAISPNGQFARLVAKDGSTIYSKQFEDVRRQVVFGFRVI